MARSVAERMRQQVQYDQKLHEAEQMLDNSGMALNAMEHNIEDLLAHNQALGQQVEALQAQLQTAEAASAALQQEVADAKQAKLKVLDQKAEVEAVAIRWQTEVMKLQVSTKAAALVHSALLEAAGCLSCLVEHPSG
jgi:chromosome segregation ATPase